MLSSPPRTNSYGSPIYSPVLDTIAEVFEYDESPQQVASPPITPLETPDGTATFMLPEAAHPVDPTVSMGPKTRGIISSPRKNLTVRASSKVASVLRKVLETDHVRRRRALRIYLKAIVFMKLLMKAHERYGSLMATQGAYMHR
jgi:hypothetical protein